MPDAVTPSPVSHSPGALVASKPSRPVNPWITVLLLFVGVQCWLLVTHGFWARNYQPELVVLMFALAAIPPLRRLLYRVVQWCAAPTPLRRAVTAYAVAAIAAIALYGTAVYNQRDFIPMVHDEFAYRLGAQHLAIGRLWMPAHPLADFFESMHLIISPVYAERYYPGTAMGLVPAVWLHVPLWVASLAWAAAAVGWCYRVVAELVDGATALLAALMLASLETFRMASIMTMANIPVLVLGLILIWAWLRWRRQLWWPWMIVMGTAVGWALLTRPQDVPCFVLPVGIGVLIDLRRRPLRQWTLNALAGMLGVLPFVVLAFVCNKGVTGDWLTPPWAHYARMYEPANELTFRGNQIPAAIPASLQPQKRIFAHGLDRSFLQHAEGNFAVWTCDRLESVFDLGLPHPLMYGLLPLGIYATLRRKAMVLAAAVPLWALIYAGYFWRFSLYVIPIFVGGIVIILLGANLLINSWPALRSYLTVAVYGSIMVLSLTNWPQLNRMPEDTMRFMQHSTLAQVNRQLAALPSEPTLVLFKFDPSWDVTLEPVYNVDVAWPDDAPMIRAHDEGPQRDSLLFAYYAAHHQANRSVYQYDQKDGQLTYLGKAGELANTKDR